MDFAQLKWRAEKLSSRTSPEAMSSPADAGEAVNDAYMELVGLEQWEFLYDVVTVPTLVDVDTYTLPAPLRAIGQAFLDGKHLRPRGTHSPAARGVTVAEYERLGMLDVRLRPAPAVAGELVLHGWAQPAVLSLASDVPVLPPEFHRTIAYLAAIALLLGGPVEEGDQRAEAYSRIVAGDVDRLRGLSQRSHDRTVSKIGMRRTVRR